VSLLDVLGGFTLLIALIWVALAITRTIERSLVGVQGITPRGRVIIIKLSRVTLIAIAVLVALPTMGINFGALAIFSGALGVGIGIGLQKQVSNLLSGLFLLLDKSIKPGDVIEVGETFGWVKQMTARYVGVITRENKEILIPNDDFVVNQVINWSHSDRKVRMEISFGVSYDSDPHEVRRMAVESAKTPKRVAQDPAPVCHLIAFGDSSIDFVLRFWIVDPEEGVTNLKGQIFLALWDVFKEKGIEIPFPRRHLILDQTSLAGINKDA
jgi:small-conductance mechanosensitive channel